MTYPFSDKVPNSCEQVSRQAGNLIFEKFEQARGRQILLCVATAVVYLRPNSRPERSSQKTTWLPRLDKSHTATYIWCTYHPIVYSRHCSVKINGRGVSSWQFGRWCFKICSQHCAFRRAGFLRRLAPISNDMHRSCALFIMVTFAALLQIKEVGTL